MNGKKRIKSVKSSKYRRGQKPLKRKILKASTLKEKSSKSQKKVKVEGGKIFKKSNKPSLKTHPSKKKVSIQATVKAKRATVGVRPMERNRIVRIMGQGQFTVDNKILEKT